LESVRAIPLKNGVGEGEFLFSKKRDFSLENQYISTFKIPKEQFFRYLKRCKYKFSRGKIPLFSKIKTYHPHFFIIE